jgi:subtilisin-like proprotein convertase family protein
MQLQRDLSAKIGNSNYDIGHLLGASGGGGNAGCIGCVCNNPISQNDLAKGSGYSSPSDGRPEGDTFDIDFVAHEIGHQLGANHTFSHEIEGTGVSVEPGSGSTIMGYAGLTDYNVKLNSDDYFSKVSIEQILTNLSAKSCPVVTTLSSQTPTVNAGPDYVIPKGTPFYLKGTSTDPNGDSISYCWEQIDSAINTSGSSSIAFPTKENGPVFRSIYPSSSPIRFFPSFSNVLNGVLRSKWESVLDISRELNFALTVRDNALGNVAQTNSDTMKVQVDASAGPFELLSQSEADLSWPASSFQTITWAVNNTMKLPGASHVNIKLSIDGGQTFPLVLKSNTPNDGSELIVVPKGVVGKNCRLLIEPVSSIFYAVNKESFAIGYSSVTTCSTYDFPTPFVIPESATPLTRTILVPVNTSMISDVNVKVEMSHEYISDVQIELVSPQRRVIKLLENKCGDTNNSLKLNFDDQGAELNCTSSLLQNVVPINPLNVLNDSNPSGNWSIRARDMFSGDTGSIQSASVTICTKTFTPIAPFEIDLSAVLVYPNPSQGEFNVIFTSDQVAEKTIMVHDLIGRKIYEKQFPSTTIFYETIQLVNVQTGIYIVTVKDGSRQLTKKLVIE